MFYIKVLCQSQILLYQIGISDRAVVRLSRDTRIRKKIISLKKKVDAVLSLNKLCFKQTHADKKNQKGPMINLFI